jgi:hypothetical protein
MIVSKNATNYAGEFVWTHDDKDAVNSNGPEEFYPQEEGIDMYGSQLFFVCKHIQELYVLNLDDGTYYNQITVNGFFDGKPDQMQQLSRRALPGGGNFQQGGSSSMRRDWTVDVEGGQFHNERGS